MIKVKDLDIKEVYRNLYTLFYSISLMSDRVKDVHSVDIDKTSDGYLNIIFTYNDDYVVYISLDYNGNILIDTTDTIRNYVITRILTRYPNYRQLLSNYKHLL